MSDMWAAWLLEHRFGGDTDLRDQTMPMLFAIRDRVLAGARVEAGDVVLDVGCGDGLVALGALPMVGDGGRVIFSDVSAELLEHCRAIAADLGHSTRSTFVHTGLPDLDGVPEESVDVATTRSVLIYVADKFRCFASLFRVLRPGGRLSIFEPINRFGFPEPADSLLGFSVAGLEPVADKVKAVYRRYQPDGNPMIDFDERDLLAAAEQAGFGEVHLDYHVDIDREPIGMSWAALLRCAPNPVVPPLERVLDEALSPAERTLLTERLREQVRHGSSRRRFASAYLTAVR